MRRLSVLAAFFLLLAASASQAQTAYINASSFDGMKNSEPAESKARFALSKIDSEIAKHFEKAWQQSVQGLAITEALVLILRLSSGAYKAVSGGHTNQPYQFTFAWHPAIIAIIHTHPNKCDPKPYGNDIRIADRYGVPVLTITKSGMFMYDPATKQITKVHDGLDWLEPSRWD